jgi:hypothetical protein
MTVKLVCDACKKGLKIPNTVLGKKIKCPSCGAVFVAQQPPPPPEPPTLLPDLSLDDEEPARSAPEPVEEAAPVLSAADDEDEAAPPPKKKAAVIEEDEDEPKPKKKAAVVEDDEEEPKPKKKAAVVEDDDEEEPKPKKKAVAAAEDDEEEPKPKKKAAAVVDEDDEPAKPAKKKKAEVVEEEGDEDEDKPKKKAKVKAPWYLFLFSLLPLVLVIAVPFGVPYAGSVKSDFMTDLYAGIGIAAGTTLLCLLLTVLPFPRWLRVLLVFFFLLVGFGAAGGWILYEVETSKIDPNKRGENPPPPKEVALAGGLKYVDERLGEGPEVKPGDAMEISYQTSLLKDSKMVESKRNFRCKLDDKLIKGWNEGIPGMKAGGRRKLIIPAALAYDKKGSPPDIPADADIVTHIELVKINP